jgi:Domain of unknown function (DUF6916)
MTKRRDFLIGCGSALIATGVSFPTTLLAQAAPPRLDIRFSKKGFDRLLNRQFLVFSRQQGTVHLTLVQVRDRNSQPDREQFTLILRGAGPESLRAGTYDIMAVDAGYNFQLYLEPAGPGPGGIHYRADLNLLV